MTLVLKTTCYLLHLAHVAHAASLCRFSVTNNGTIITVSVLDYEKGARYEFLLEAKDGGGLFYEKRSSTTIIVNINDINDNTPSFVNLPYTVIVDENLLSSNGIFKVCLINTHFKWTLGCSNTLHP